LENSRTELKVQLKLITAEKYTIVYTKELKNLHLLKIMYVVCVTRNKSIAVTTLHSLMTLNMYAAQKQIHIEHVFVEGLASLPKLIKSGERIIWFDYGTNLDQESVPRLLSVMEKDIKVTVFPSVVEGVAWDMFRKKTEAGSTEPVHQRALNFDTEVDNKITGTDLYDVKKTSARVWVMDSKPVDKKLRGQTFDSYESLFSKIKGAGIRVAAYAGATVVRHFTYECLGNILEMPGVMMKP